MVFWRKKKNEGMQDQERADDELLHHKTDPELSPLIEAENDLAPDNVMAKSMNAIEPRDLTDAHTTPVPDHTPVDDFKESEDLKDHTNEGGWFSRLSKGLSKSSNKLGQSITDVFTKRKLDQEALDELEEILIMADMGPKTAAKIVAAFSENRFDKEIEESEIKSVLASSMSDILKPVAIPLDINGKKPFVMLVCGVNGAGKTTTIGKLAHEYHMKQHKKVMIAAADTFRAAAVDQLEVWAKRAHVPLIKKDIGSDPAAVAFEALEKAKADDVDLLMIDTAGRLQNKANLMEELAKIIRVIKKQDDTAPHAIVLVLDSTTGQNAHSQVQNFKDVVNLTGLVVTKLDGSAKGGVVVSLAQEFGLPIHAVGVGEKIEDLSPFKAEEFAKALVGA
ncbi:MAG: signal recognition particle-docking protein FtsY [Alphaproteobacteria bacterium]|nr:signal recognition particle-docking protein FtsY [Alphaproteobacteria bacterium]NCQ87793.1 signal recognition particle-docking protein FtsY [Alphaproteobacteria bacterium]NCT05699.1 signal recognition particle-docking protein FtsY [Alphaproteobacteria bacterium]